MSTKQIVFAALMLLVGCGNQGLLNRRSETTIAPATSQNPELQSESAQQAGDDAQTSVTQPTAAVGVGASTQQTQQAGGHAAGGDMAGGNVNESPTRIILMLTVLIVVVAMVATVPLTIFVYLVLHRLGVARAFMDVLKGKSG